jgi:peptidoglycan/xylan/chitin deacetylase (PgdA/CDA1 family)
MNTWLPAFAWRAAARLRARGGAHARLLILTYHRILARRDSLLGDDVDAVEFEWQMRLLARHFRVRPLPAAVEALYAGRLEPGTVCVTLDDGYADNCTLALPILRRLGLSATFFIATEFLNGGRMWNDTVIESLRRTRLPQVDLSELQLGTVAVSTQAERKEAIDHCIGGLKYLPPRERAARCERLADLCAVELPRDLMMTDAMVAELAQAGMDVGGHTHSHPIMATVSAAEAASEIRAGVQKLERLTGRQVVSFAYPNGRPRQDYTKRDAELVRDAGLKLAVTTARGVNDVASDRYQLARLAPWDRTPIRFLLRILQAYGWRGDRVS